MDQVKELIQKHDLKESVIKTWKSAHGFVAAVLHKGKLHFCGGDTEQEAIARLEKMVKW